MHAPNVRMYEAISVVCVFAKCKAYPASWTSELLSFLDFLVLFYMPVLLKWVFSLAIIMLDLARSNMPSHPKRHRELRDRYAHWVWEDLALVVSISSLLAIILIASTSHGKPVRRLPLGVTLNAAISVFSTIMKTTMLYCTSEAISQSK